MRCAVKAERPDCANGALLPLLGALNATALAKVNPRKFRSMSFIAASGIALINTLSERQYLIPKVYPASQAFNFDGEHIGACKLLR